MDNIGWFMARWCDKCVKEFEFINFKATQCDILARIEKDKSIMPEEIQLTKDGFQCDMFDKIYATVNTNG